MGKSPGELMILENPTQDVRYSYFIFRGVMLAVALVMVRFFKRKNWL